MSGPSAMDTTIPRQQFEKENKAAIIHMIDDLVEMSTSYLCID
jgi:hypothetical protein